MTRGVAAKIRAFENCHPAAYALLVALACALLDFVVLHAFRLVPSFNEGTYLAPAEGIGPVLGLFFGLPALVGCTLANVLSDVLCGLHAPGVLAVRAMAEALYLTVPYALWYHHFRQDPASRPQLDSAHKLGVYLVIALITSLGAVITNALVDGMTAHLGTVMRYTILSLNDLTFLIYLGMPLLIALNQLPLPARRPRLLCRLFERLDDEGDTGEGVAAGPAADASGVRAPEVGVPAAVSSVLLSSAPPIGAALAAFPSTLPAGAGPAVSAMHEAPESTCMNLTQRMVIAGVLGAVAVTVVLNVLYFIPYPFYQDYHEIMPDAISGAYALSAIFAVLIFVPTAVALRFLEDHYTRPIECVTEALSLFLERLRAGQRGCTSVELAGATPLNEVRDLVQAAERMQVSLADHIDRLSVALKERERVSAELDIAQRIQMSVIPHEFSRFAELGLDVFGFMRPAREVGGDFFDVLDMGEGRVGIIIGDVSGKGVPAALFMMRALNTLRSQMLACDDLGAVMTAANDVLYQRDELELFVTVFICVLDTRTGRLRYANAGHMPPLVRRGDAGLSWLACDPERVVGVRRAHRYAQHELRLAPGDGVLLYTDGVTDAADASRAFFGAEGLEAAVRQVERVRRAPRPGNAAGIGSEEPAQVGLAGVRPALEFIANQVDLFAADAPQADDMTMLAFSWRPAALEELRSA